MPISNLGGRDGEIYCASKKQRGTILGALWTKLSACMQNLKFQGLHNEVIPCPRFFVVFRNWEGDGGGATGG